jgi:hypothetical protein
MNIPVVWLTDDRCPSCGTPLIATSTDACVTQECRSCGRAITWAPERAGGER